MIIIYPFETIVSDSSYHDWHRDCAQCSLSQTKDCVFFSAMRHYRDALIQARFNVCYIPFDSQKPDRLLRLKANAPGIKTLVVRYIVDASFRSVIDTFV